jgi:hypothetical protein
MSQVTAVTQTGSGGGSGAYTHEWGSGALGRADEGHVWSAR